MATAKKTTTKKTATKKSPAKKRTVASAATRRKTSTTRSRKNDMRSFHVAKDQVPFNTLKITRQTVYWVILVSFIIFAQLWIIKLQVEVANIIEAQQISY